MYSFALKYIVEAVISFMYFEELSIVLPNNLSSFAFFS